MLAFDSPTSQAALVQLSRNASVISSSSSNSSESSLLLNQPRSSRFRTFSSPRTRSPASGAATPTRTRTPAYLNGSLYAQDASTPTGGAYASSSAQHTRGAASSKAKSRSNSAGARLGPNDFQFGQVLGEGSYSTVMEATYPPTQKVYAIKVIDKEPLIRKNLVRVAGIEKNALVRLREGAHPGIVKLHWAFQDDWSWYLVLDLVPQGNLQSLINRLGSLSVPSTQWYIAQIIDTIAWMHSKGVVHRDLKPENVLLGEDWRIKISDYGSAKLFDVGKGGGGAASEDDRSNSWVCTPQYVPPELLIGGIMNKSSDFWAIGVILYQLLFGKFPFTGSSNYLMWVNVRNLAYELPPRGLEGCVEERIVDLVERLLVIDPETRLGAGPPESEYALHKLKSHAFFEGFEWGSIWTEPMPVIEPGFVRRELEEEVIVSEEEDEFVWERRDENEEAVSDNDADADAEESMDGHGAYPPPQPSRPRPTITLPPPPAPSSFFPHLHHAQTETETETLLPFTTFLSPFSATPTLVPSPPETPSSTQPSSSLEELMKNIIKVKASKDKLSLVDSSGSQTSKPKDFDDKIKEIRDMARQIRETEGQEQSQVDEDEQEEHDVDGEFPDEIKVIEQHREGDVSFTGNISNGRSEQDISIEGTSLETFSVAANSMNAESLSKVVSFDNGAVQASSASSAEVLKDRQKINQDGKSSSQITVTKEVVQSSDTHDGKSCMSETNSIKMKPRVIRSVKEAREFLSRKRGKQEFDQPLVKTLQEGAPVSRQSSNIESDKNMSQILEVDNKDFGPAIFDGTSESISAPNASESSTMTDGEYGPIKKDYAGYSNEGYRVSDSQNSASSLIRDVAGGSTETRPSVKTENWMENNFHEVEPIVKKIGVGFRDNFMVAREKVNSDIDINQLASEDDDDEREWMNDDKLREIVFHVQENELAGRDPFYLMDAEDKRAFFQGLEKKVEKVNEKLSRVHEFLHSNIENLDYGADGISLYDAPEKIIPRWKGPPLEKNPQVLDDYLKQRKTLFAANNGTSYLSKKDEENFLQNVTESPTHENTAATLATNELKKKQDEDPKHSKTVIEGSDGSVRSGKKSGKEYWQHTKKWTRGFLESYNAETDPEVKSAMKDIGKDLDRWITEEEIEEAAGLMTNLSDRNKKFMEKKLNKIKREMELFGPQAVVSKYNEYAEEKEEDYLWWLDLPHVLCIELYTNEEGGQRIGFYSLEMAADLELEPKPCHVIAFEDASDCKNLCYIIQAHLEMLGNGHAFVVPRPPKDAFREAKANGFSVTVIRRGELQQLNVDQTLEEVEEQITEIGSKMYHDMIMKGRSVDISSVMKGVLGGGDKPTKRKRAKRMLKRPSRK